MAAKKKIEKPAPKTYTTLKALLSAKSKGTLPRGVKVEMDMGSIEWRANGVLVFRMDIEDYAYAAVKSSGFTLAK